MSKFKEELREKLVDYETIIHGTNEQTAYIMVDSFLAVKNFANTILEVDNVEENKKIISDAFKPNCELSELLEQRNEMLAMLENVVNLFKRGEFDTDENIGGRQLIKAEQLIKKVKDNE